MTEDDGEDWFQHLSPDGRWILFLSFPAGTRGHGDRMPGMRLRLRQVPSARLTQAPIATLTTFFGGQGTINVNSWSPDSKRFAYVIYSPVP